MFFPLFSPFPLSLSLHQTLPARFLQFFQSTFSSSYIHWHRVNKQAVKVFSSHHSMKCQLNRCFDEGPSSSASLHSFIYGNISEAVSRFSYHFSVFFKSKHIRRSLILYSDHIQFQRASESLVWLSISENGSAPKAQFGLVLMNYFYHFFRTIPGVLAKFNVGYNQHNINLIDCALLGFAKRNITSQNLSVKGEAIRGGIFRPNFESILQLSLEIL